MASVQVDGATVKSGKPPPTLYMKNPNIGRRTGIDVLAGKNIRKDEDGNEIFADYFSEKEEEESFFDKSLATTQPLPAQLDQGAAIKSRKPQSSLNWKNPNIGRRTGVDVTAGKNIRRDEEGNEIFADYFSEKEEESFFDKSVAPKQFLIAQSTNAEGEIQVSVPSVAMGSSLTEPHVGEVVVVVEEPVPVDLPQEIGQAVCIPQDILFDTGGEMGFIGVEDVVIEVESTEPNVDLVADSAESDDADLVIDNREELEVAESVEKLTVQDAKILNSNGDNQELASDERTDTAANQSSAKSVQLTHTESDGKPYTVPLCETENVNLAVIQTLQDTEVPHGTVKIGTSPVNDMNCSIRPEVTVPDVLDSESSTRNTSCEHSSELQSQREAASRRSKASEIKTVENVKSSVTSVPLRLGGRSKSPRLQNNASVINQDNNRNSPVISSNVVSNKSKELVADNVVRTDVAAGQASPSSPVGFEEQQKTVTDSVSVESHSLRSTRNKLVKSVASLSVSETRKSVRRSSVKRQQVSNEKRMPVNRDPPEQGTAPETNGEISNLGVAGVDLVSKTCSVVAKPVAAVPEKIRPSQKRYSEELDISPVVGQKDVSQGDKKTHSSDEETSDEEGRVLMHYSSVTQEEEENEDAVTHQVRSPSHSAGSALSGAEFTRLLNKKSINETDLDNVFNKRGVQRSRGSQKKPVTPRKQVKTPNKSALSEKTRVQPRTPVKSRSSSHKENLPLKTVSKKIVSPSSPVQTPLSSKSLRRSKVESSKNKSPVKKMKLDKSPVKEVGGKAVRRTVQGLRDKAALPKMNRITPRSDAKATTKKVKEVIASQVTRPKKYGRLLQRLAAADSMNNMLNNEVDSTPEPVTPKKRVSNEKEMLSSRKRSIKGKVLTPSSLPVKRRKTVIQDKSKSKGSHLAQKVTKRDTKSLVLSKKKSKPLVKTMALKKLLPKRHTSNLSKTFTKPQSFKISRAAATSKTKTKIKTAVKKTKTTVQSHAQRKLKDKAKNLKEKKIGIKNGLGFLKKQPKVAKHLLASGSKISTPIKKSPKSAVLMSNKKVSKSRAMTRGSEKPLKSKPTLLVASAKREHKSAESEKHVPSKTTSLSTRSKTAKSPVSRGKLPTVVKKVVKGRKADKQIVKRSKVSNELPPSLKRPANLRRNSSLVDIKTPVSQKAPLDDTAESNKVSSSVKKTGKRSLNRSSLQPPTPDLETLSLQVIKSSKKGKKLVVPNNLSTSHKTVLKEPLRSSKTSPSQKRSREPSSKTISSPPPPGLRNQKRKNLDSPENANINSGVTKLKANYLYLSQKNLENSKQSRTKSTLVKPNRQSNSSKIVPLVATENLVLPSDQSRKPRRGKQVQDKLEPMPTQTHSPSEANHERSISSGIVVDSAEIEYEFNDELESEPELLQQPKQTLVQKPLDQISPKKRDSLRKPARSQRNAHKHIETGKTSHENLESKVKNKIQRTKQSTRSGLTNINETSDLMVEVPPPVTVKKSTPPKQGNQLQGKTSHDKREQKEKNKIQGTKKATRSEKDQLSNDNETSDLEVDISSPPPVAAKKSTSPVQEEQLEGEISPERNKEIIQPPKKLTRSENDHVNNVDETSDVEAELPSSVAVKRSASPVQGEQLQEIVLSHRNLVWLGPEGSSAQISDPFTVAKCFQQQRFSSGFMKIRPFKTTPLQVLTDQSLVFVVKFGRLRVQVHHNVWIMESGDTFMVPVGNAYRIENIRHDDATMVYFSTEHTEP